ncbi:uncharacterized protein Bfra_006985 [Botrytis fragariae]|uniref:Amidoligase enzyme protein n=1 Tax=Botrytis fragariae TaxID=1964551 RepID=A0A8H6AHJ9_9HELO|nr:uncharacterized protein Bfra_006985 [Botrytis fragariae]KAF5867787.1 hypothetical protein Bfra_006985 [Botrytis fragariae]
MADEHTLPPTSPIVMTFGFELEFGVKSVPDQFLDPEPDDPRRVHGITRPENYPKDQFLPYLGSPDVIEENEVLHGETVNNFNTQLDALQTDMAKLLTENGLPAVAQLDEEQPEHPSIKDLKYWVVSNDATINHCLDPDPGYFWWPIEIQSPAYIYNEENKQKVRNVLQCIDSNYRTNCDLSADIHVHVGNGQKGFDARTVRRFMAFVYTFENQIATIHPPHYMTQRAFSKPVRTHSFLAQVARDNRAKIERPGAEESLREFDEDFIIDSILERDTVDDLVKLLSSPELEEDRLYKRLTYSICNLGTDAEKVKKTIEFRQHKSTFDDEEVYHWITICASLVHFASTVDEEVLRKFCKEHFHKTVDEFSIVEVLMALGRPAQAYYYGIRLFAGKAERAEEERKLNKEIEDENRKQEQEREHRRNLEERRRQEEADLQIEEKRLEQEEKKRQQDEEEERRLEDLLKKLGKGDLE